MCKKKILFALSVLISFVFLFVGGCSQDIAKGHAAMSGSNVYLSNVSVEQAFEAAKKALTQYYKIDYVDNQRLVIVSMPAEYSSKKTEASLSEAVSPVIGPSRRSYRRVARIKIRQTSSGQVIATVRVEIQRRDTETMRSFAYQRQAEDRPSEIPVEQTAVKTGPKYEVWTTVRRDYSQERAILNTLKEVLSKRQ